MQNIKQLRESLTRNYEQMTKKKLPIQTGKELANTAGKILSSCKVELEYNRTMGYKKKIDFLEY